MEFYPHFFIIMKIEFIIIYTIISEHLTFINLISNVFSKKMPSALTFVQ